MKSISNKTVLSVLTTCFISLTALIQSPLESKADEFCRNIKNESQCEKLKDDYERALKPYIEEDNYLETLKQLDKVIRSNKRLSHAYFARALIYYIELLDYSNALKEVNMVIKLDPTFSNAYALRSYFATFELGDFKQSIKDANKSVEIDPENALALLVRGFAKSEYAYELLEQDKVNKAEMLAKEAIEDFTSVIDQPSFKVSNILAKRQFPYGILNDAYLERGYLYIELGTLYRTNNKAKNRTMFREMFKLAVDDFSYLIKNAPDRGDDNDYGFVYPSKADGYRQRGNAYSWNDDFLRACKDWKKAKGLGDEDSMENYRVSCLGR